jgi:DNA replication protein DnaD
MDNILKQINYRYILVDSYKNLGLNENDLAVLLVTDNILKEEPMLVTNEILALKMTLSVDDIDVILSSLIKRGFITYDHLDKSIVTSMKPTYDKIEKMFLDNLLQRTLDQKDTAKVEEERNIFLTLQKELGRSLSPAEIEKVRDWVNDNIDKEVIITCLHECQARLKRVTINALDKQIQKYLSSRDIEKEGYSAVNEKCKKDIARAIDIANVKWTND